MPPLHLTLQQLRLFEAVSRLGSFTAAAEELRLTQPAVSIQIRRLEDNCGQPLIEHVGRRFRLTPAGHEVQAAAADMLARLRGLEIALEDLTDTVSGPLALSVVTTAKYFIPHLLGAFVAEHPAVVPRLTVTNRARVIERLETGEDDLVIMGRVPAGLDLDVHPFLETRLVVVAPPAHPLTTQAEKRPLPLGRVAGERLLMREPGSGTRAALERLLAERGLAARPFMELGSTEAIKQAVMAGLGLSVLPLDCMELELACGRIAVLAVEEFPLVRRWNAVHRRGRPLTRVARTFLDQLNRLAAGDARHP